jgi:pimeloyl-ACP methyl ester carboxylesterase
MSATGLGQLRVPGAVLHYKWRGSGPVLLVLPSGSADADGCDLLAEQLSDQYTVVSYDRRGQTRSPLDHGQPYPSVETHSDDAERLLASLTSESAEVFGCSVGAMIGLDLAARHPGRVRTLVAHEPPAPSLLRGAERADAVRGQELVADTYRDAGRWAAMRQLALHTGTCGAALEPGVKPARPSLRAAANADFFLAHESSAFRGYTVPVSALVEGRSRVVPATGQDSRHVWTHRCAQELAHQLDVRPPSSLAPMRAIGRIPAGSPTCFARRSTEPRPSRSPRRCRPGTLGAAMVRPIHLATASADRSRALASFPLTSHLDVVGRPRRPFPGKVVP